MRTAREKLEENMIDIEDEGIVLYDEDDFSDSLIGTTYDGRAVYDFNAMVEEYARKHNISHEESADFICFNYLGFSPVGDHAPLIIFPLLV